MMKTTPTVAPWQSCIRCYRGDTTTGFIVEGEPEWIIAAMHELAGLPTEDAARVVTADTGIAGMVLDGRMTRVVTLCSDCAAMTGARLVEIAEVRNGETGLPVMRQDVE